MIDLPDIILVDEATDGRGASADLLLISVDDAIGWIAEGQLPQPAQRPWQQFFFDWNDPSHDDQPEASHSRQQLAIELILAAIQAGRLRCVYVYESVDRPLKDVSRPRLATIRYTDAEQAPIYDVDWNAPPILALAYADPRQFHGQALGYDFDGPDGFTILFGNSSDIGECRTMGFQFLWSEVLQIRPGGTPADDSLPATPRPSKSAGQTIAKEKSRSGAKTIHDHGGAIANLILFLQARGIDTLMEEKKDGVPDEYYGELLREEYGRLSSTPAIDSLRKIAGGAVKALLAASERGVVRR